MKKVEVIKIPVRYDGATFKAGESFEMEAEHVNESLVKVTGEAEKTPKTISEMTIPELKEYAAEHEIDLGEAKKRDEILEVIQAEEDGETPEE